MLHAAINMREAPRMQLQSADCLPILREAARCPIALGMSAEEIIDYDELRRLVSLGLADFKSPRWVSMAATNKKNPDLIRNLLTGTDPLLPGVVGICTVMKIPLSAVMKGLSVSESPEDSEATDGGSWLTVSGEVEAGVFRAQPEWGPEDWYQVELEPLSDGHQHHGLIVRGRSMDRIFPQGTILRVVDAISSGYALMHDDYVVVERRQGDLVELTCKRLSMRPDGNYELIAESFLDQFQEPIFIGRPVDGSDGDFDHIEDNEIRVRALVVDAHLPIRRRRTRPVPKN